MAESAAARPRITGQREAELYEAVLELLREGSYDALTMDAVATRARSSKATLYRLWGDKATMVAKAIWHSKSIALDEIDTGSLRGDLRALVLVDDDAEMERSAALMRGLASEVHRNEALRKAVRELLVEPEMAELNRVVQRAVERGEVRPDCPALEFLLQLMIGGFTTRALLDEQPPTQSYLLSYIDAVVLPALGVPVD